MTDSWDQRAAAALAEPAALNKAALAEALLADAGRLDLAVPPRALPLDQPARPEKPALVPPHQVPKRGLGSEHGRAALLHALAHIELNAVDLALDMALRFASEITREDRAAFVCDWLTVAGEEGLHFRLLHERLEAHGARYGDQPAHDGLWDAARKTKHDVKARLAIAPMVLEARGLDVTPGLIEKLTSIGDTASAAVLERIYRDEIGHVRCGVRWFIRLCGGDPESEFADLVGRYFPAGPKPPFNVWARDKAELPEDWYRDLVPL